MNSTRKGAIRRSDVTPEILAALNAGTIEALTLAESLSIDFAALVRAIAPDFPETAHAEMSAARELGVVRRMQTAGVVLLAHAGPQALERWAGHASDSVRGMLAYVVAGLPGLSLAERLEKIRPIADDPNAGVREWAWIALRPHVAAEIEQAFALLQPWTKEASPRLRRYASEITRPRGVWCAHVSSLKTDASPGLPLLEALRADPEKYVQDSVANWLNDAAKSQPKLVRELCARWLQESPGKATARICRRAQRSLAD